MRRRGRWLAMLAGTLGALAVVAGTRGSARDGADAWTALMHAGAHGGPVDLPLTGKRMRLTPRQAYLLAFHEAVDTGDPEHTLAVAERLDALGEVDLAARVRRAADRILGETRQGPRPPPVPG